MIMITIMIMMITIIIIAIVVVVVVVVVVVIVVVAVFYINCFILLVSYNCRISPMLDITVCTHTHHHSASFMQHL